MKRILLVVEGDGEVQAAPILARRVLHELHNGYEWDFDLHKRKDIAHLQANEWSNLRRYLAAAFNENMPILWMLDCDDGCPVDHARQFYSQVRNVELRQPLAFVFWVREYEAMFLYDRETLANKLDVRKFSDIPEKPEVRRDVKGWISAQLPSGRTYKPMVDQAALSASVDLKKLSKGYHSFRHFERALLWLTHQQIPSLYPLKDFD